MRHLLIMPALALSLSACSWVEVTPNGQGVTLATDHSQTSNCQQLGEVSANVMNRFFFSRDQGKVAAELADLARNRAAEMGGDTIISNSAIDEGKQSFAVFKCQP